MSVRAQEAYDNGEKPLSKWTKKDIIDRISEILWEDGELTISDFQKLRLAELKSVVLIFSSWHHTSNHFNCTDFYEVDEGRVLSLSKKDLDRIIDSRKSKPKEETEKRARCKYLVWSGTNRHPKAMAETESGVIRGNWFYGDSGIKKSITANGFEIIRYL